MAAAIDQVHDGNQAKAITHASLLQAMEAALETFQIAFDVPMIKKWHWMLHLPDHLARYGLLPNCFAQERKHKPIGQQANLLTNQKLYERHLLDQVVAKEISHLDAPDLFPEGVFLFKPRPASKKVLANLNLLLETKVTAAVCCNAAKVRGATISTGDAILYHAGHRVQPHWQVGEVQNHFNFGGHCSTLIKARDIHSYMPSQQYCKCTRSDTLGFIPIETILVAVVHTKGQQDSKVLLPYPIYSKDL